MRYKLDMKKVTIMSFSEMNEVMQGIPFSRKLKCCEGGKYDKIHRGNGFGKKRFRILHYRMA